MEKLISNLKLVKRSLLKYDYISLFTVILITLILLSKALYLSIILSYIIAAFYYVIKNIIKYKGFSLVEIFILFVPVLGIISTSLYYINNLFIK